MTIDDHIKLVKRLEGSHQRAADNPDFPGERRQGHLRTVYQLQELRRFLDEQGRKVEPLPADFANLSDLPQELLEELSTPQADELESQIHAVLVACGGTADLDQILIGLYRRFDTVQKRRFVQNKLYRMGRKRLVHSVPHRRGVYTVSKPEDEEQPSAPTSSDLDDEIPF